MMRIFQALAARRSAAQAERMRDAARRRGDFAAARRHDAQAKQLGAAATGSWLLHFIETLWEHFRSI